ncbi:WD repeat-containing protein 7 [Anastrepha obliqua]|uniref:WD repeat-containing protein 7 n=1 Tax=Anastrepha obliqua TaxID=95512 RepID=UPI002409DA15|nr:WD repeat-containing protein 7 [Anastrepha obliqua]XP_054730502.1 WD repeat-containing protein 7 [Anastrepha obliqua]
MVSTNLVVPVVLWGPSAPTHCVSSVFLSDDQSTLVTGCYDGQICLWQVDPVTMKMSPRCLLVGHSAPVLCLVRASVLPDNNFLVSSSENGEMCTWDLIDGKCMESVKLPQVHTQIQSYHPANSDDVRLFCIGYYPEIIVMDPFSLEIIYQLSSKVKPDWISALHVLRPMKRKDDVVLAITTTGTVKVWTLIGNENKHAEPIYENESKEIRCLNAITMNCCAQNQRTVLIVCTKYWQIYDAGDFTVLCSVIAPTRERWQGGDFISSDRVMLWTDEGKGYLYKLPANCIPDNKEFHAKSVVRDAPYLYYILQQPGDKVLSCPPAMKLLRYQREEGKSTQHYLLRGDSEGYISVWTVPEVPLDNISILQAKQMPPRVLKPTVCTSLVEAWSIMDPPPVGILDQLSRITETPVKLTSSIYLPQQSRLVIGREDGTIVIVPATQTVMMQLLVGIKQNFSDWPSHQILYGHRGRVNCLLCPSLVHPRYEKSHLLSGGVDFAVCLWDLYSGSLLHRFCVHAGEITQLLVPPEICSNRILKCICSVASDHSVTLLSLQERKCVTLASRHLFPVITIKWRPLDDFLIVGCSDGSVYVWQMETGHLDRVLHGMLAEEVLLACDEQSADDGSGGHSGATAATSEMGMANPAVHFFRGIKSRNMNAIRHATQRGIHQLQQLQGHNQGNFDFLMKHRSNPLVIQGLRTNPKDAESHILFFDIEGLIFELHSEEYAQMTPAALEALGVVLNNQKDKAVHMDASKKISDFFGKVKNKAGDMEKILKDKDKHGLVQKFKEKTEQMEKKVQAKVESFQKVVETQEQPDDLRSKIASKMEVTHVMEVAQLLLSLLHSWGLDPHLDKVCESQLGLLRPIVPVSFGVLSKAGYMSLLLPTWQNNYQIPDNIPPTPSSSKKRDIAPELLRQEQLTAVFTSRLHWELSTTLTSNHILALVAMSNTLMSMCAASFLPDSEKSKKLQRLAQRTDSTLSNEEEREELIAHHTSQIKQGWSLLSTHHCFLLPDKIEALEPRKFKRPQVEAMAKRWQHHCIEIREAAQQILLGELTRMGKKGRKQLVDSWAQYLPLYTHTEPIVQPQVLAAAQGNGGNGTNGHSTAVDNQDEEYEEEEEEIIRKPSSLSELKRKQTTAVILLGVIGAEFGQDISQDSPQRANADRRKSSVAEGFGIANNLARLTSMALAHLLYAPPSQKLPKYTPLRRAAIDLLGRGFTVWEPYLDVSKVLLGLLEIACAGKSVPNLNYKLPLTPQADACRTARHALRLIATARPAAFITTMAREVARYNTMQQNAQSINQPLTQSVLFKAKSEILLCVEMLIDKMQAEIASLLVEVMDITLHCVDNNELKSRGLAEVCPSVCKFNQISHCAQTRRIAVGAHNGHLAIYELRQNKCQMIPAHTHPITSLAFSPDGKFLVSYSCSENRLSFWQTSTGMFGLGNSQTRCTKGYSTAPIPDVSRLNPMRLAKLVWINNRTVTLMLADGSETRFNV